MTEIFDKVRAIDQNIHARWPGNRAVDGYNLDITVSHWPISVQHAEDPLSDYFLIQLQGKAHLGARHDFQVRAYEISYAIGQDHVEVIDTSPDTTESVTTYTASASTTVGGSFGFYGDTPTGSVSASETITHSTTQNVADLRIMNGQDKNKITYLIARDSLLTKSETPLLCQLLLKRPHSDDDLTVRLNFRAYFSGGDRGDWLQGLDWNGLEDWTSHFTGDELPDYISESAAVDLMYHVHLKAPPVPNS